MLLDKQKEAGKALLAENDHWLNLSDEEEESDVDAHMYLLGIWPEGSDKGIAEGSITGRSVLEPIDIKSEYDPLVKRVRTECTLITIKAEVDDLDQRYLLHSVTQGDFHMGIESNQPKVNMLKRDQSLPNIENVSADTVLVNPEFRMVYKNGKGDKCFLRFSQIARYCDGTLMLLRDQLRSKIALHDKGSKKLEVRDRALIVRALETIEERMEYRNTLQKFEILFAIRRRYVPNWHQFKL
ncbi:hypothetical protein L6452_15242 [Arctium lappa]|uniref:Uncharacterized protein n=1 Tax=Arctium lappa TaxID=4217 RepID=A0ACB9CNT2_ARCLA|nr:hypothetical protein L6452_15242 [Arctium lappa]